MPPAERKLSILVSQKETSTTPASPVAIHQYRRFSERINRSRNAGGRPAWEKHRRENEIIDQDPAVQSYYRHCATHRGNNGILSSSTKDYTHSGVKQFLRYAGIELSNHAILDLVNYKRNNPLSTDIERCIQDYAAEPPIKASAGRANFIIGIFKANFARLSVSVNNHFDPEEEDCSTETFLNVWEALDDEAQDLVQWGGFVLP